MQFLRLYFHDECPCIGSGQRSVFAYKEGLGMQLFCSYTLVGTSISAEDYAQVARNAIEQLLDKTAIEVIEKRRDSFLKLHVQFDREITEELLSRLRAFFTPPEIIANVRKRARPTVNPGA